MISYLCMGCDRCVYCAMFARRAVGGMDAVGGGVAGCVGRASATEHGYHRGAGGITPPAGDLDCWCRLPARPERESTLSILPAKTASDA